MQEQPVPQVRQQQAGKVKTKKQSLVVADDYTE